MSLEYRIGETSELGHFKSIRQVDVVFIMFWQLFCNEEKKKNIIVFYLWRPRWSITRLGVPGVKCSFSGPINAAKAILWHAWLEMHFQCIFRMAVKFQTTSQHKRTRTLWQTLAVMNRLLSILQSEQFIMSKGLLYLKHWWIGTFCTYLPFHMLVFHSECQGY